MNATHDLCTSLEEFTGVLFSISEQHVSFEQARQNKYAADIIQTCNHKKFEDLKHYMEYELALSPLALFSRGGM